VGGAAGRCRIPHPVAAGLGEQQQRASFAEEDQVAAVTAQVGGFDPEGHADQLGALQQGPQLVEGLSGGAGQGDGSGAMAFREPEQEGGEGAIPCRRSLG
jgi:hypothetical protein